MTENTGNSNLTLQKKLPCIGGDTVYIGAYRYNIIIACLEQKSQNYYWELKTTKTVVRPSLA